MAHDNSTEYTGCIGSAAYVALGAVAIVLVIAGAVYVLQQSRSLSSGSTTTIPAATTTAAATTTVNSVRTVSNPGSLTLAQISGYPRCDLNRTYNTTFVCSVGDTIASNYTLIMSSVNANGTVSFYSYTIPGALVPNATYPSTAVVYAIGAVIGNECGMKFTLLNSSYLGQYITIGASHSRTRCPT